jgi:hypothetical protein
MPATLRPSRLRHGGAHRARSATVTRALLAALALAAGACSSGSAKHALPPTPTTLPTASTAFATSTTATSTTTTTPVVTTTTTPLHVVDLGGCPVGDPSTELTRLNTGPDLARDLVPIDALNVRICKYAAGKDPSLLGISWLALSEAAAFAAQTNGLPATTEPGTTEPTTEPGVTCTGATQDSVAYLLTFAIDTQTVNLYAGGCPPTVSNGTLTAPVTRLWYRDLARYASPADLASQGP